MGLRVHHLNCGTMNTSVARMVCHVLLIETPRGLVLVDSGMSGADFAEPAARLGPMRHVLGLAADPQEFAVNQVRALGFDATFVRMWDFYLAYSEAGFASRYLDDWQLEIMRLPNGQA